MGAVPKRRISNGRRKRRRAHSALRPPQLVLCPQCKQPMLPHRACPNCGTYQGREVIKIEEK